MTKITQSKAVIQLSNWTIPQKLTRITQSQAVRQFSNPIAIGSTILQFNLLWIPFIFFFFLISFQDASTQIQWGIDSTLQKGLPEGIQVYKNLTSPDDSPFIAYYVSISLKNKDFIFDTDTSKGRRLTPRAFFHKLDSPLIVVNGTFFSFNTHQNVNAVMSNSRLIAYHEHSVKGSGADSAYYFHPFRGALGINKKHKPDIAWLFTDSTRRYPYAFQQVRSFIKNQKPTVEIKELEPRIHNWLIPWKKRGINKKWKMETAIGGGPVLIQNGNILISSKEERMFANTEETKHPRTAMGYTSTDLVILCIQGRMPGIASGAGLIQVAQIFKDLGCIEAINLDGGGSSCMLIKGKETIKPSDAIGQRAIPAVFYVKNKK